MIKSIIQLSTMLLLMFYTSCDTLPKDMIEYQIDNPLDHEIVVSIDEKEYNIPSGRGMLFLRLKQGRHTLAYDGDTVSFIIKVNPKNRPAVIVNPTLSNYMLHTYHIDKWSNDTCYISHSHGYEYQSEEGMVRLPVSVENSFFIEVKDYRGWSFGPNKGKPEVANKEVPPVDYKLYRYRSIDKNLLLRIYREADYLAEFDKDLPEGIVFPVNSKKLSEQPVYKLDDESLYPNYLSSFIVK